MIGLEVVLESVCYLYIVIYKDEFPANLKDVLRQYRQETFAVSCSFVRHVDKVIFHHFVMSVVKPHLGYCKQKL